MNSTIIEKPNLLYLDDEQVNLDGFYYSFSDYFEIHRALTPDHAFDILNKNEIKVVITDQRMPKMSGTEFIKKVKDQNSTIAFIILTGYSDLDVILDAINNLKIYGFIQKPYNEHELKIMINNAYESYLLNETNNKLLKELKIKNEKLKQLQKQLEAENIVLKEEFNNQFTTDIITQNTNFIKLLQKIEQAAASDAPVLIEGETGTGKELIARALYKMSYRKNKPLITINCAALPDALIESELFGYEKGAFTGANTSKPGRFELANGGTIFLDELGELPLQVQSKLLRVLQEGEFERLGGVKTLKTDVRIIAATNRNLKNEINNRQFREDLYYRINVFTFSVPPLRERLDDISLLLNYFIYKYNQKYRKSVNLIPKETLTVLSNYSWPGNIRELENMVERSVITSNSNTFQIDSHTLNIHVANNEVLKLVDLEKNHIYNILKRTNWRIRGEGGAAKLLDIKPTTLHSKIKKLGIIKDN